MNIKVFSNLIILFIFNIGYSQINLDARMLGLNGSYTNLASGYQCVGINPANLASSSNRTLNIINTSFGFRNNFFSLATYNDISGANLEDSLSFDYYPKIDLLNKFGGIGLRLNQNFILPYPLLNFSSKNIAFTSQMKFSIDMGIPEALFDLILFGNPIGKEFSIGLEEYIVFNQEFGFSYAKKFNGFMLGTSIKYLMGIFYMGVEEVNSSYIKTDITAFTGQSQYLIQQAIGGAGLGLDIGFSTEELPNGIKIGSSIINLLGTIKWTQSNFIRSNLENTISNAAGDYYLRQNEMLYYSFLIDSINASSFSGSGSDSLITSQNYNVVIVSDSSSIPWHLLSSDDSLKVIFSDIGYLVPSETLYDSLTNDTDSPFLTREPAYFRLGLSKRWPENVIIAGDLVTGFSNRLGSSDKWRLSIGAEILKFNPFIIRCGYALGGYEKSSFSLGSGYHLGPIWFDFGFALKGGFNIENAKGFDLSLGVTWRSKIKD